MERTIERPAERRTEERSVTDHGFEAMYRTYSRNALSLAYLLTGDRLQAEDLMQDAFVKVGGAFGHIRSRDAFWPYLRRTIVNLHNSGLRRLRLERAHIKRTADSVREGTPEIDIAASVDVWRAIQQLPSRQRAAIVLRFYEDLTEADAAVLMRCSTAAYKSLLSRATTAMRELMGGSR
jgi:RNA polymerase sigma factor (sigma-70 family)